MSDIFREVEEEVRRERFDRIWKQYGDYIIAGVALIIIAIAGYELWQRYEQNQRMKASETLLAGLHLAEAGDLGRAGAALSVVAKDAPDGYAQMARFSEAGVLLSTGKRDEAVAIFKAIAAKDGGPIGQAALLRAGWASADTASKQDLQTLLAPLTDPTSPWRHSAREILAYADYHAGRLGAAGGEFQAIADDKDAPESMRQRAGAMASFLKSGGLGDYGIVPKPVAPATPPAQPTAPTGSPK
ncbi:MAG TPA: tetratricopeptide repeat protein [Rhizomicrobium sp.]